MIALLASGLVIVAGQMAIYASANRRKRPAPDSPERKIL